MGGLGPWGRRSEKGAHHALFCNLTVVAETNFFLEPFLDSGVKFLRLDIEPLGVWKSAK
jgi:hypothetical protein